MRKMFIIEGFGGMCEESFDFDTVIFGEENAKKYFQRNIPDKNIPFDRYTDLHVLYMYNATIDNNGIVVKIGDPIHEYRR